MLHSDDYGYFFAFESFPGPWPLSGFVNELNGTEADHQAILEEMGVRGLVEQVGSGWQPTPAGQQAFAAGQETLRGENVYDGAKTLAEAASRLRQEADRLERLERDGWQLVTEVEDDHGYLLHLEAGASHVALMPEGPRSRLSALAAARR